MISDQVQLPEMVYNNRFVTADLDHFSKIQNGAVHVKCRLRTEYGLLFFGLERMGVLFSRTHLLGENNSPQSAFYTNQIKNSVDILLFSMNY